MLLCKLCKHVIGANSLIHVHFIYYSTGAAPVDEGVMSLYSGINPSDALLHVMTVNNQSIELPIRSISELRDFDIDPDRRTLVYVNAYYTDDTYLSVISHLKFLQATRRDLNIVVVDFAQDLLQLYTAVRHHVTVQGYFISKILAALEQHGIAPQNVTLAGHSVGANIAALGAKIFAEQHSGNGAERHVGQMIAIDPALMCRDADIFVNSNISTRVVVIHGEGDKFGVRDRLGTIDIYPNGIGYFPRKKQQPGCSSSVCSHLYPFLLFMESLIEGVMIPAVKCNSWLEFRKNTCDSTNKVVIGLKYPKEASGVYFCMTQPNPPFTFMEHGLKYKRNKKGTNQIKTNSL